MIYCTRCVIPSTRPDLMMNDGVCDACRSAEAKKTRIDWRKRHIEWLELVAWAKETARARGNPYDCIAAVSGGKDSSFIAHHAVQSGLNVLGVSFEPTAMTPRGQRNLENLQRWCDVIQIKKNREVYRKISRHAFQTVGDHDWPNHVGIFTSTMREAVLRNIPVMLWGESPQAEYGAPSESARRGKTLDRKWMEEFGGLLGLRISDVAATLGLSASETVPYTYPSADDIGRVGVQSVFLGHYRFWDAKAQLAEVVKHGFEVSPTPMEGAIYNFENLDCALVGMHDMGMYVKYGFGRATSQACIDIRNGRLSREEAIRLVEERDGKYPDYVWEHFSEYLQMPRAEVDAIFDSFTNPAIFEFDGDRPKRDSNGHIVKKEPIR